MREKTRKIFIMIVMAALIVSLMAASFAALTYGRYTGGKLDDDSPYDEIIDFVGETAFEVSTADELVNAINNGYSYIKIADDAEEPFVINNNVADVYTNLVLDVNGHVVVRNSRNPLLDVRRSISVVLVYDSSTDADGGFYNPVGSSLQTSGGTLTVGEGVYESGPRTDTSSSATDTVSATVYSRGDDRTAKSYSVVVENQTLPKLAKDTGDVYLDENYSGTGDYLKADTYLIYTEEKNAFVRKAGDTVGGTVLQEEQFYVNAKETSSGGTTTITADKFSPICDVASCDFYYYYPVSGTAGTAGSLQTYAVVYGYNDVKALARDEKKTDENGIEYGMASALTGSGLVWPYAAIRSVEDEDTQEGGVTHARGGVFKTHFGEENTYCIYSAGGTMTVGTSGSAGGPAFEAVGSGVCIAMTGASDNVSEGGSLTISGGTFSSRLGNTIEMEGGNMTVTAGTFKKNAAVDGAQTGERANNGSAISISGGTLSMTGTGTKTFTITGNYVNGIKMEKAENDATANIADTIENAAFSFNNNSFGNSVAAIQVRNGSLNVSDSTFDFNQGHTGTASANNGIYVQGGSVNATDCEFSFSQPIDEGGTIGSVSASACIYSSGGTVEATRCQFTIPGNNNYGIYSSITEEGAGEGEYDTTAKGCDFTMTGNQNHGIYAAGGKTLASGGTYTIGSENGSGQTANFGIQVSSGSVALAGVTLDVYGEKSSCVYAVDGTISLSGNNAVNMHFSSDKTTISSTAISTEGGAIEVTGGSTSVSSDALGITARQNDGKEGSISIANGAAVTVGSKNSPLHVTGVYVNGGKIENKGTLTVFSTIDGDLSWNESNKYNGVYVYGGSLKSEGELNVTFTGVQNDAYGSGANSNLNANTAYRDFQIKSYAVRVEAGTNTTVSTEVTIAGGTISNSVGGGVYVGGGKVTLGVENDNTGPTVRTTGTVSYSTSMDPDGGNWNYFLPQTGGPAVKVAQSGSVSSTLTVYGGTYTAQQGDGIVTVGGKSYIYSGTFIGRDFGVASGKRAGPGASYSFKVYGGMANVYGGTFGGQENGSYINSSGAFVMGTENSPGTANIYGGSFVVSEVLSNNADNGGQAGFSVYEYGNVLVAPKGGENGTGTDVTMTGLAAGLVIEGNTSNTVSVEIKGGEFSSTRNHGYSDGIWYSNSNATLTISGGTFTGYARSGLYFEATPNTIDSDNTIMIVQISGGCFKGKPERDGGSSNYKSGAIAGKIGSYWDPGYSVGVNYILKIGARISSSGWGNDETVQDGDGSSKWNDAIQETLASCSWIEIS